MKPEIGRTSVVDGAAGGRAPIAGIVGGGVIGAGAGARGARGTTGTPGDVGAATPPLDRRASKASVKSPVVVWERGGGNELGGRVGTGCGSGDGIASAGDDVTDGAVGTAGAGSGAGGAGAGRASTGS